MAMSSRRTTRRGRRGSDAVLITDAELNILDEGLDVLIAPPAQALEQMNDFVRDMHTTSGLLEELPRELRSPPA